MLVYYPVPVDYIVICVKYIMLLFCCIFIQIYGLAHTTSRYSGKLEWLLRPKQEAIPGLYITGQDVVSAGIAGATAGGFMCAVTLQPFLLLDMAISYLIECV